MPYIHFYACANPIECPKSDRQLLHFRLNRNFRNDNAKYNMPLSYGCHYNIGKEYLIW